MVLAPNPIEGPQATPGRRGLLEQATQPPLDVRWLTGVVPLPDACASATPQGIDYCSTSAGNLPELAMPSQVPWAPFLVFGYDVCSTMGGRPDDERVARARRNLAATASHQAEQQYGTNAAAITDYPHLSDGTATEVTTAAAAPGWALAALDGALSRCLRGQRGMIHAAPEVVALWEQTSGLHREGTTLLTTNDHIVVSGSGYPGNDPDDAAPAAGSSWAYGTDLVYAARGPVQVLGDEAGRFNPATNEIRAYVYQAVLLWQAKCCRLAAQVDVSEPT